MTKVLDTVLGLLGALVLVCLFVFVFTPVGVFARVFGKDLLLLKFDRKKETYWIDRAPSQAMKDSFKSQY